MDALTLANRNTAPQEANLLTGRWPTGAKALTVSISITGSSGRPPSTDAGVPPCRKHGGLEDSRVKKKGYAGL